MSPESQHLAKPSTQASSWKNRMSESAASLGARKRSVEEDEEESAEESEPIKKRLKSISSSASEDPENQDAIQIEQEEKMILAPDGNLVVVVGATKRRIRVHALFLQNCSPVLKKIISDALEKAAVNQNVSEWEVKEFEVEFPEDDEHAFEVLCLHFHKPNSHTRFIWPELALEVAILAKKYECTDHFFHASESWLYDLMSTSRQSGALRWTLLVAAYLFDNATWFRAISRVLSEQGCQSFMQFVHIYHDQAFSWKLALALQEKRSSQRGLAGSNNLKSRGLCLECFSKATINFERRWDCAECSTDFDTIVPNPITRDYSSSGIRDINGRHVDNGGSGLSVLKKPQSVIPSYGGIPDSRFN